MSRLKFLIQALRNFRQVGTVTRSSRALSSKMGSFIVSEDKFVLELGAGDGALTHGILQRLHPEGKLLCFEINPTLHKALESIDDTRLIAINDSAENMEKYMKEEGIDRFDAIVSAIPYIVLPEELALRILRLCKKNLKEGKYYLQVHYAKTKTSLYEGIFGNLKTHRVWMNIPPAFVFQCVNN